MRDNEVEYLLPRAFSVGEIGGRGLKTKRRRTTAVHLLPVPRHPTRVSLPPRAQRRALIRAVLTRA